jgi:hypothetical protein
MNLVKVLTLFLVFNSFTTFAQEAENCTLIGRWAEGPCYTVDMNDQFAFLGNGAYLEIIDISEPENPVELAKYLTPSFIYSIVVEGNYVYLANEDLGLRILDVTDRSNPIEIAFLEIQGFYSRIAFNNDFIYYSTNSSEPLQIIDVSDPELPTVVRILDVYSRSKMTVQGDYLYLAARWDGFEIYNIATPADPFKIGSIGDIYCEDVDVSGNYAYLSVFDSLLIVDISMPTDPFTVGVLYPEFGSIQTCKIENNVAYIGQRNTLKIMDVADPEVPVSLGHYTNNPGFIHNMLVMNHTALLASGTNGINIIDVSNPAAPESTGSFDTAGDSYGIAVRNDLAFLANGWDGLRIIDISNPEEPYAIGNYDTEELALKVKLSGDHAYVANSSEGLLILDISDPLNPIKAGQLDFGIGSARDVIIQENIAFVAQNNAGLRIVDISDVQNPQEIGFYDTEGYAYSVDVSGNYAYVADWDKGIRIIDISDKMNPFEIGYLEDLGHLRSVAVSGNYAYVGLTNPYVKVVDISDPANPFLVTQYFTARAYSILISDNYAYVSAGYNGMIIHDISDPTDPVEVGYYDTGGEVYDAVLYDDNIYMADLTTGMTIIQFDETTSVDELLEKTENELYLSTCYPNPAVDRVMIEYLVPERSPVRIRILDATGNLIKILVSSMHNSGSFECAWDCTDLQNRQLSNGVYFCQVNIGGSVSTGKIIIADQ